MYCAVPAMFYLCRPSLKPPSMHLYLSFGKSFCVCASFFFRSGIPDLLCVWPFHMPHVFNALCLGFQGELCRGLSTGVAPCIRPFCFGISAAVLSAILFDAICLRFQCTFVFRFSLCLFFCSAFTFADFLPFFPFCWH